MILNICVEKDCDKTTKTRKAFENIKIPMQITKINFMRLCPVDALKQFLFQNKRANCFPKCRLSNCPAVQVDIKSNVSNTRLYIMFKTR